MEPIFITTVVKYGTSLALVIPKPLLEQLHIGRGDLMIFGRFAEGQFSARRVTDKEIETLRPEEVKI